VRAYVRTYEPADVAILDRTIYAKLSLAMGVRAQTPLLAALSYVDVQLSTGAAFHGPTPARLEEEVEGVIAKPLAQVLRDVLCVLLRSIEQAHGDACALEGCCHLLGHLTENYEAAYDLLKELGAPRVLACALHAQPEHAGVVNEALWALAYIEGATAIVQALYDPVLSASQGVVRAAVRALSHLPDCKYPDIQGAIRWADRRRMAQIVVTAMVSHKNDAEMRVLGCSALGSLMASWLPDVVHIEAAGVLPVLFDVMRADFGSAKLQASAVHAVSSIVAGNVHAAEVVRAEPNAAVLCHVIAVHASEPEVRQRIASIIVSVEGLPGLVRSLEQFDTEGMHRDLLWSLAGLSDESAYSVVDTCAVGCVKAVFDRWGSGVGHAAVAALGRCVLLLLAGCARCSAPTGEEIKAVELALRVIIDSLCALWSSSPLRSTAFECLAQAALQSTWAREALCASPELQEALERWRTSKQLETPELKAVMFLVGALEKSPEPILKAMEDFPQWQPLQQAACAAIASLIETDDDDSLGTLGMLAPNVADRASAALRRIPHPWRSLRLAGMKVLSLTLGRIGDAHGAQGVAVLARGCEDLLETVRFLHGRSAHETLLAVQALVTVALESPAARQLLTTSGGGAVKLLAEVVRDSAASAPPALLAEALLALGLLGGVRIICDLMTARHEDYWFQVSGCMAIGDLARVSGLAGATEADLECATLTVQQSSRALCGRGENAVLHSHTAVVLKLLEIAAR